MKPSKTRKIKSKIKAELRSRSYSKSSESVIADAKEIEETEDEGKRSLAWLISAFPCFSLEQIDAAYQEVGGDAYKAAGILGTELVEPGESTGSAGKKRSACKQKRFAASSGMVSGVIGKDYSKSASACCGERRGWGGPMEVCSYINEEAKYFLCSMLGDDSELGMCIVSDVLSQCGYDLEKALDALLDISKFSNKQFKKRIDVDHIELVSGEHKKCGVRNSEIHCEMLSKYPSRNAQISFQLADKSPVSKYHPSAKEEDILRYVGSDCRDRLKVPLNTKDQLFSTSVMVNSFLQQKVLESLFNIPEVPYVVSSMSWKEVLKQVESFGQGFELNFEGTAEPLSKPRSVGKEDDYHAFRSVAEKNWVTMRGYYKKATLAYSRGERAHASYLSEKGKFYKKLAQEADEKASQEIFEARNKGIKNTVIIDLHGQHVKQAIRLLKLHLLMFICIPSVHFLRIITGCGADGVGLGKLKRTVLDLVQTEGIKYNEENSGTILLCLEGKRSFTFMESEVDSDETN